MEVACITGLSLHTLNVVDTVYYINTSAATAVVMDAPTFTVTPASCYNNYVLTIHPSTDLAASAPSYLTIFNDSGIEKVQIMSDQATDVTAETTYVIKASDQTGAITDTTASFKLTMA